MRHLITFSILLGLSTALSAQMVAKMTSKEPIEGLCDVNEVYALLPMLDKNQVKAVCPFTEAEIIKKLNEEVKYLKENPKYKGKGMVNLVINCKGELVRCIINDAKEKNKELDEQIVAVFKSLGIWKTGTINGKEVDSADHFTFQIKNGVLTKG